MTRETIRRSDRREPSRPVQPAAPPAGILALQRGAGNQAVSAWLARQVAPAQPLPAIADGLKHYRAAQARIATLAGKPAPADALDIAAAVAWLTEVSETLSGLSSPSQLIFESTLVTGYDGEYAHAESATKDMLAVVVPATKAFGTRLRDAIVASINQSSVVEHAQNPELGTLDQATALRQRATALGSLDSMLGFQDAALACEDAALALLQARSVNEARTTWRAQTLRSDAGNAGRAQNEVDDVVADSGFGNRQEVGDDWCGMFASASMFRAAAFDPQLRAAFSHTDNVWDFFRYTPKKADRTPVSIFAEGQWWDLKAYHETRGLPRTFIEGPDAGADLRPGDVALIRHAGVEPVAIHAKANHIAMVESYDPVSGTLTTIEGNVITGVKPGADGKAERTASGDLKFGSAPADHSISMIQQRNMNDDATLTPGAGAGGKYQSSGRRTVWFVGRPSLIDFEQHDYGTEPVPDRFRFHTPDQIRAEAAGLLQKRFGAHSAANGPYHQRVGH